MKSWLSESIPLGLGDVLRSLNWQIATVLLAMLEPELWWGSTVLPIGPWARSTGCRSAS